MTDWGLEIRGSGSFGPPGATGPLENHHFVAPGEAHGDDVRRGAVVAPVVVATAGPDAVAGVTKASPPTQSAPVRSRAGAARVHRVQRWTVAVAAAGLGFGLTACGSAAKPAPVAVGSTTTAST
jgi:hypothetical protein